jgi:type VI secretion system protein ImpH
MAPEIRTEDIDVALAKVRESLFNEPQAFDFFQAVRLLERLQPEKSPVGRYSHPRNEAVHFGVSPTLSFPASAIHGLESQPDQVPQMTINFMGLVGPLGVLPTYITELVAERKRAKDKTFLEFLDIFNHRLASLFFQAWNKNHFDIAYERDRSDEVTKILYALVGFGTPGLRGRQAIEDETLLYYSGLFSLIPRSAVALEAILEDQFNVSVHIEPFIGTWRSLGESDRCIFESEFPDSTTLGFGAVIGDEIWDRQSRLRIQIGPLDIEQYQAFLPTGSAWPQLQALVKNFAGPGLEFEVQLILRREDVPTLELRNPSEGKMLLGWHTWLNSGLPFHRDPSDTILLFADS